MTLPGEVRTATDSVSPLHVGILIPGLHAGGAEFVARQWITEMAALGHRVTVYVYDVNQPRVELPADVVVHRFTTRLRAARYGLLPMWLHRRVTEDSPDVLVSLLVYSNVVALLTWALYDHDDIPLLVSERNMPSLQGLTARGRSRLTFWLARRLYRRAAGVLAISHPVGGDLVSAFNVAADRLYVVPNPVISHGPRTTEAYDAPTNLHICFVGRLVNQKRPSLFLEVLEALAQRGISVRGTVVGGGVLRDRTERESLRLGLDVAFLGWQEPWWEAVGEVHCLVLTASFEGLANVLVEAAAAGIPSVACSRALGVADALLPGITGELAMTDDPDSFADAVLRACARPPAGQLDLQGWLDHFSSSRSTASLLTAIRAASDRAAP
jgi:glycosyltransferase involved in cell wall biosynthesis